MKEFNLWKEARKKIPPAKIEIIPDDEHDAKVAAQFSAIYNYLMETADFGHNDAFGIKKDGDN